MDGVLTDGQLIVFDKNNWYRQMCVRDGYALQFAAKMGFKILVVSGSDAPPVTERLHELGISEVFMKVKNKKEFLQKYFSERSLSFEHALFMGDDIPDLHALKLCAIASCPSDAVAEIKSVCNYISPFKGGSGCVREVIEKVMKLNGKWTENIDISST